MAHQFRKLNMDLPRQPLSDQKIWAVVGWILAIIIVILTALSYIKYTAGSDIGQVDNHIEGNVTECSHTILLSLRS